MIRLTGRETEVLGVIAKGLTARQISDMLGLSPRTVESHRATIGAKTGIGLAAELTRLWIEGQSSG